MNEFPACDHRGVKGTSRCWCHRNTELPIWVKIDTCHQCPLVVASDPKIQETVQTERVKWKFGDMISNALSSIGVTEERVQTWIGAPCGCAERREKINEISSWAQDVVEGKLADAKMAFERLITKRI